MASISREEIRLSHCFSSQQQSTTNALPLPTVFAATGDSPYQPLEHHLRELIDLSVHYFVISRERVTQI